MHCLLLGPASHLFSTKVAYIKCIYSAPAGKAQLVSTKVVHECTCWSSTWTVAVVQHTAVHKSISAALTGKSEHELVPEPSAAFSKRRLHLARRPSKLRATRSFALPLPAQLRQRNAFGHVVFSLAEHRVGLASDWLSLHPVGVAKVASSPGCVLHLPLFDTRHMCCNTCCKI